MLMAGRYGATGRRSIPDSWGRSVGRVGAVRVPDRITRACRQDLDDRALREVLRDELRSVVPFDAYAWVLTDPETGVGSSPLAEVPSLADLPAIIKLKYLSEVNRWTDDDVARARASTLVAATGGDRHRSRLWAERLDRYGIDDVASVSFRDDFGVWGFLDLWRAAAPFTADEVDLLVAISDVVTPALRTSLLRTFTFTSPSTGEPVDGVGDRDGPAVVLLSDELDVIAQTSQIDADLRSLLPTGADAAPVPAAVYQVAAQLLAVEQQVDGHPPRARAHQRDRWVTLAAGRTESAGTELIAVTIEPTTPADRTALYARVAGLTGRETELLAGIVAGDDTRTLADELHISPHTVQDHLKSIFAKTGVHNRKKLVACAAGVR
jgi:DNA-binding CsgD family transcriptional regulator